MKKEYKYLDKLDKLSYLIDLEKLKKRIDKINSVVDREVNTFELLSELEQYKVIYELLKEIKNNYKDYGITVFEKNKHNLVIYNLYIDS